MKLAHSKMLLNANELIYGILDWLEWNLWNQSIYAHLANANSKEKKIDEQNYRTKNKNFGMSTKMADQTFRLHIELACSLH